MSASICSFAAPGIDQVGAAERAIALEFPEQLEIEDARRRRRVRQQCDKNFRAGQKGVETVTARETPRCRAMRFCARATSPAT